MLNKLTISYGATEPSRGDERYAPRRSSRVGSSTVTRPGVNSTWTVDLTVFPARRAD